MDADLAADCWWGDTRGLQCKTGREAISIYNRLTLASLIQSLHTLGLWPLPDSESWIHSASQLWDTLARLTIPHDPAHRVC